MALVSTYTHNEGFIPSASSPLARHSESDVAKTYFITADFSSIENPNINTEIIGYTLSEQISPDIIEFFLDGPVLAIMVKTPATILPYSVKFRTSGNELKVVHNTFETGEENGVDYFLLNKSNTPVELIINVTARSYDQLGNTLETRSAEYKLIIVGDYSVSKYQLINALLARGLSI